MLIPLFSYKQKDLIKKAAAVRETTSREQGGRLSGSVRQDGTRTGGTPVATSLD